MTGLGGAAGYGEIMLSRADDASLQVNVSAVFENGFQFGATHYGGNSLFVSTNGLVSFGGAVNGVQPNLANLTRPFLAAFHADVDTRLDGEGPESGPVWVDVDPNADVVTITWQEVGFYRRDASFTNTFQIQLYDQGAAGIDIVFRYEQINWTTGDLQGGWNGLGVDAAQIALRLSALGPVMWHGASGHQASLLNLPNMIGNTGVAGLWVYHYAPPLVVNGGAGADVLTAASSADSLFGGAGHDSLRGGLGADSLFGGTGFDYADYSQAAAVAVNLTTPSDSQGEAEGDVFNSVEGLIGSGFGDTLTGDGGSNIIFGGAGHDVIGDAAGHDTLYGGAGDDVFCAGAGVDRYDGGTGRDTIRFDEAPAGIRLDLARPETSTGHALGDVLIGIEVIIGSDHGDILLGNVAANNLSGAGGGDFIVGNGGADSLYGGAGNDTLDGGAGPDLLHGGAGLDVVSYGNAASAVRVDLADPVQNRGALVLGDEYVDLEGIAGSGFHDTLRGDGFDNSLLGRGGNDLLEGRAGDDSLSGDAGNDTLIGGLGADTLTGGAGTDLASYALASPGLVVDLLVQTNNRGEAAGDRLYDIEILKGSAHGDGLRGDANANWLYGEWGHDDLRGNGGVDFLYGGAGNDTLNGGAGADQLNGGSGVNLASYLQASAAVVVSLANPAVNIGEAKGDKFHQIANLQGSRFADRLTGNLAANRLEGGAGADTLQSGAASDTLNGGAGADVLQGGTGLDFASYQGALAMVVANLGNSTGNRGDAAGDRYEGIEGLIGSGFGDALIGRAAADQLYGEDGDDTLTGGSGADGLFGGAGVDWADYSTAKAGVRADLSQPNLSTGDARGDRFFQIEAFRGSNFADHLTGNGLGNLIDAQDGNDTLEGGGGNDRLSGGAGADQLFGGAGQDVLTGGLGRDQLWGGTGADVFQLIDRSQGGDVIADYTPTEGDALTIARDIARSDLTVSFQVHSGVGHSDVAEAIITHRPSGQILWIIADGAQLDDIFLTVGTTSYDLL